MTSLKRPVVALGAAALLALSLTACGGDDSGGGSDDAPASASKDDFCKAFSDAFTPLANLSGDPTEDQFNDFKDAVSKLGDVGTPSDISDDNRKGFEVFIDAVHDGSYDDFKSESDSLPGVNADDEAKAEAFFTWASTECAAELGVPTDVPTDSGAS
ncbi:hypothetical protein [Nocardioides panacisoli]|uniref:Lipoprotein n=1 Tax=Nocardioides panacisoli TaxID=627624 RepID=A0ABP7IIF0_9ACTN